MVLTRQHDAPDKVRAGPVVDIRRGGVDWRLRRGALAATTARMKVGFGSMCPVPGGYREVLIYSVEEAAELLGVARRSVYQLLSRANANGERASLDAHGEGNPFGSVVVLASWVERRIATGSGRRSVKEVELAFPAHSLRLPLEVADRVAPEEGRAALEGRVAPAPAVETAISAEARIQLAEVEASAERARRLELEAAAAAERERGLRQRAAELEEEVSRLRASLQLQLAAHQALVGPSRAPGAGTSPG